MARIMIIDDEKDIRIMLREMLEQEGFEITDACGGKEAIQIQLQTPADLMITDIIMPDMEGIETIFEFRQRFPKVKIIAISGGGIVKPEAYLDMAKSFGVSYTFRKPVERKELLGAVYELLGH
jgi:CheY-like chemotaxis protein